MAAKILINKMLVRREVELIAEELRAICLDAPILLVGSKTDLRGTTKVHKGCASRQN